MRQREQVTELVANDVSSGIYPAANWVGPHYSREMVN